MTANGDGGLSDGETLSIEAKEDQTIERELRLCGRLW
jgi:hypothetical protein